MFVDGTTVSAGSASFQTSISAAHLLFTAPNCADGTAHAGGEGCRGQTDLTAQWACRSPPVARRSSGTRRRRMAMVREQDRLRRDAGSSPAIPSAGRRGRSSRSHSACTIASASISAGHSDSASVVTIVCHLLTSTSRASALVRWLRCSGPAITAGTVCCRESLLINITPTSPRDDPCLPIPTSDTTARRAFEGSISTGPAAIPARAQRFPPPWTGPMPVGDGPPQGRTSPRRRSSQSAIRVRDGSPMASITNGISSSVSRNPPAML